SRRQRSNNVASERMPAGMPAWPPGKAAPRDRWGWVFDAAMPEFTPAYVGSTRELRHRHAGFARRRDRLVGLPAPAANAGRNAGIAGLEAGATEDPSGRNVGVKVRESPCITAREGCNAGRLNRIIAACS